jgi:hypothetical protein
MPQITKIAVQVEYDGKAYAVRLESGTTQLAAHMLAGFCKDGVLQLTPLPNECRFDLLENVIKGVSL